MPYLNIKNPYDRVKSDWVHINGAGKSLKKKVIKWEQDTEGVFTKMRQNKRVLDAGVLQEELIKHGIAVSHEPDMSPNGVTCSSAGILIALEEEPSQQGIKKIKLAIRIATEVKRGKEDLSKKGKFGEKEKGNPQII